jgi:hypothetical protein
VIALVVIGKSCLDEADGHLDSQDKALPRAPRDLQLIGVCRIKPLRRLCCCALAVCGYGEGDRWTLQRLANL